MGDDYQRPETFSAGFHTAMLICTGLLVAGGLLAAATIRNPPRRPGKPTSERHFCAVEGPPMHASDPRQPAGDRLAALSRRGLANHAADAASLDADRRQTPAGADAADQPLLAQHALPFAARVDHLGHSVSRRALRDRLRPPRPRAGDRLELGAAPRVCAPRQKRGRLLRTLFARADAARVDVRSGLCRSRWPSARRSTRTPSTPAMRPRRRTGCCACWRRSSACSAQFRGEFLGKCSPVHFFWGAFDLAVTRFSGRRAPEYHGAAPFVHRHVMHESYSHEVSSAGFWTGDDTSPPVFYSYAAPEPPGFRERPYDPHGASYYEATRRVRPALYRGAPGQRCRCHTARHFSARRTSRPADRGGWDREVLEQRPYCVCTPAQIAALQHGGTHVRR